MFRRYVPIRGDKKDREEIPGVYFLDDKTGDSMAKKYNFAIKKTLFDLNDGGQSSKPKFKENREWICFQHDDLMFNTPPEEVEWMLNNKVPKNVAICGVIGTINVENSLHWWVPFREINGAGHINQAILENGVPKEPLQTYPMNDWPGYHPGMASVDGCVMFIRVSALREGLRFDEQLPDYHFYDVDICLEALARGYDIATLPIEVTHVSPGILPPNINELRVIAFNKWNNRTHGKWPINKFTKFYP